VDGPSLALVGRLAVLSAESTESAGDLSIDGLTDEQLLKLEIVISKLLAELPFVSRVARVSRRNIHPQAQQRERSNDYAHGRSPAEYLPRPPHSQSQCNAEIAIRVGFVRTDGR
jgi:hypothetical protein